MLTIRALSAFAFALIACAVAHAHAPAPFEARARRVEIPVGQWKVTFGNGVVETYSVERDGTARVVEPNRTAVGKASLKRGAVVIACEDDRTERWTRVSGRMVVEHWFPASAYPDGTPVRGVAERAR